MSLPVPDGDVPEHLRFAADVVNQFTIGFDEEEWSYEPWELPDNLRRHATFIESAAEREHEKIKVMASVIEMATNRVLNLVGVESADIDWREAARHAIASMKAK